MEFSWIQKGVSKKRNCEGTPTIIIQNPWNYAITDSNDTTNIAPMHNNFHLTHVEIRHDDDDDDYPETRSTILILQEAIFRAMKLLRGRISGAQRCTDNLQFAEDITSSDKGIEEYRRKENSLLIRTPIIILSWIILFHSGNKLILEEVWISYSCLWD